MKITHWEKMQQSGELFEDWQKQGFKKAKPTLPKNVGKKKKKSKPKKPKLKKKPAVK